MAVSLQPELQQALQRGLVIPACPLALTEERRLDERYQRALVRYYLAAGVGGLAVGVHTTQFAIRDPAHGLLDPVLELAAEELSRKASVVRIGGICGATKQAVSEATCLQEAGYHAGLLSLGALAKADDDTLLNHCRAVAEIIPVIGFYLQPAAGGRLLSHAFWRKFAEIDNVVAIKIAPFNRYQTIDVVRALVEAGREDIALYTGNDDNIVIDLVTPYQFRTSSGEVRSKRIVGGLLGQWAVGTRQAVKLHARCRKLSEPGTPVPADLLQTNVELTDTNAALFDAANGFAGCVPGIHEVLRRQGLLRGTWCLDPNETLGGGQIEEIDRVLHAYPHLSDDSFIAENRDQWLSG
jgi:dihydrodipicolinate synthase/N-acetylneuraminate lyase